MNTWRAQTFLACAASLALAGCGGGDDFKPTAPSAVALQSLNDVADYCNVGVPAAASVTAAVLEQSYRGTATVGNARFPTVALYAYNGYEGTDGRPWPLRLALEDRRSLPGNVSRGLAYPEATMGLQVAQSFPSAGITCIKALSAVAVDDSGRSLVWRSRHLAAIDVRSLPAPAVDGYEWIANYAPKSGLSVFSIGKAEVLPATARVCRSTGQAPLAWTCEVPAVSDAGSAWVFSAPAAGPGLYVLAAQRQE